MKLEVDRVKLLPCIEKEISGSSDCARTRSIEDLFACARTTPYVNIAWRSIAGSKFSLTENHKPLESLHSSLASNLTSAYDSTSGSQERGMSSSNEAVCDLKLKDFRKYGSRYTSNSLQCGRAQKR